MENTDSMNKDSIIVPSNTDTSNENDQTLWEVIINPVNRLSNMLCLI